MKIKSTVWQVLAAGSFGTGLLYALGIEGGAQVGSPITDTQFVTAMVLILLAVFFLRISFAAQECEERAKRRRYGRITRSHARNPEYPQDKEMGA